MLANRRHALIPIVDLKAQYQSIKKEIGEAINTALESAQFVLGSEVAAFEEEFAAYSSGAYAIALNSGTSALHLALLAAGVGPGDEVITVPFTFVATVATIEYTGAQARFVDIDPHSFTMDPSLIEPAITERTKAIVPVHLFGQPADMDPILAMARCHGLTVIEDAAQAHGSEYKKRRVGSLGDLACFSFYPTKNLGAYGEGGMVVTSNPEYARTIRLLRNWGEDGKYRHMLKGYNYRMEGLQGAILRVKLRHLEAWTQARRRHAAIYDKLLADSAVQTPQAMDYARHVYHVYAIRSRQRDALRQQLSEAGVQTTINYPIPLHLQPAYSDLGYKVGDFPHSEKLAAEQISLPVYAELTLPQIEQVCAVMTKMQVALDRTTS
jgi:dTDP-4-amino-4,6-dideoxygalactose transaminase